MTTAIHDGFVRHERMPRTVFGAKAAIFLAAVLPFCMGSAGLMEAPVWLPWVLSAAGSLAGWGLLLAGRVTAAYLRQRAAQIRKEAQAELDDCDPKNDRPAMGRIAKAAGLEAAADVLEQRKLD